MMNRSIGTGSNSTIIDLFTMMREKKLVLHPDFQRRLVWNDLHKENFLETIIKGYPFPEIYLADGEINLSTLERQKLVVDGQQRLNTIYKYINGDSDLILKKIPPFNKLSNKEAFLYYDVVVRDLKNISMDEIKEIFKRINSVSYALNAMEINNALYEGEYIKTAKRIIESQSMTELSLFDDNALSRMKDLEFVLLVMTTDELGTYFADDKEVENYIQRYDNEYQNAVEMEKTFVFLLDFINKLNLNLDSIWKSRNGMFTLLCELFFYYKNHQGNLTDLDKLKRELNYIENEVKKDNPEEEYSNFYAFLYQNTRSKKARSTRGKLLRKHLYRCCE